VKLHGNAGLSDLVPSEFVLCQNYPNPFWSKTSIKFCVPHTVRVRLDVIDSEGKRIVTLLDEEKEAGTYEVEFPAYAGHSRQSWRLPAGVYAYQLQAGTLLLEKKMKLLRRMRMPG
jgi:hypothetical protein